MADGTRTHDNWNHNPGLYRLSYSHHCMRHVQPTHHTSEHCRESARTHTGLPGGARTPDPRLRRPMLYPAELRAERSQQQARQPVYSTSSQPSALRTDRPLCSVMVVHHEPTMFVEMVGATRFERATSCSQSKHSTGLSYAPTDLRVYSIGHQHQAAIVSARRLANRSAETSSRASTMTRSSGSVPEARIRIRPASPNSCSTRDCSACNAA